MSRKVQPINASEATPISLIPLDRAEVELFTVPTDDFPPNSELHGPAPSRQFIADVALRGIIYPIVVVRKPGGGYDVRDGRNRIKTARILNIPALQTLVFSSVGTYEALTITTAANAHRRSNPHSDLAVLRRLEQDGIPASLSGLPPSTIKRLAKIGRLEPEFLDAVENGQMSMATAEVLATIDPSRRKALRDQAKKGDKITGTDVKDAKRVQVAAAASEFDSLLNAPSEPEVERYVVADPALEGFKGTTHNLDEARQIAGLAGTSFRVYRLMEV
jgi:ParB-like chromosome segregation protein Spo0J